MEFFSLEADPSEYCVKREESCRHTWVDQNLLHRTKEVIKGKKCARETSGYSEVELRATETGQTGRF